MNKKIVISILSVTIVGGTIILGIGGGGRETLAFYQGSTFEDRKAAYINDQGARWAPFTPGDTEVDSNFRRAVFSWLAGGDASKAGLSRFIPNRQSLLIG